MALNIPRLCTPVFLVKQFGGKAELWKMKTVKRWEVVWFE
jgi:hypothetical protein